MNIVYLNGEYLPITEAKISVLDRGFLFGDGVYEVIPVFGGRLFRMEQHLQRLERSLREVRIASPKLPWQEIFNTLIERHGGGNLSIYLQVTRGADKARDHGFPNPPISSTVFIMLSPGPSPDACPAAKGVAAITVPDLRWLRCDIKSIALLPNILVRQQALDEGAKEALFVRDGYVLEGAATSVFMVKNDVITTPPATQSILPGVTRDLLLELAKEHGFAYREQPILLTELQAADEIWITASTSEIRPVIQLDGKPVGNGHIGPFWHKIVEVYQVRKQQLSQSSG